jgi:hypothetical protein
MSLGESSSHFTSDALPRSGNTAHSKDEVSIPRAGNFSLCGRWRPLTRFRPVEVEERGILAVLVPRVDLLKLAR